MVRSGDAAEEIARLVDMAGASHVFYHSRYSNMLVGPLPSQNVHNPSCRLRRPGNPGESSSTAADHS